MIPFCITSTDDTCLLQALSSSLQRCEDHLITSSATGPVAYLFSGITLHQQAACCALQLADALTQLQPALQPFCQQEQQEDISLLLQQLRRTGASYPPGSQQQGLLELLQLVSHAPVIMRTSKSISLFTCHHQHI